MGRTGRRAANKPGRARRGWPPGESRDAERTRLRATGFCPRFVPRSVADGTGGAPAGQPNGCRVRRAADIAGRPAAGSRWRRAALPASLLRLRAPAGGEPPQARRTPYVAADGRTAPATRLPVRRQRAPARRSSRLAEAGGGARLAEQADDHQRRPGNRQDDHGRRPAGLSADRKSRPARGPCRTHRQGCRTHARGAAPARRRPASRTAGTAAARVAHPASAAWRDAGARALPPPRGKPAADRRVWSSTKHRCSTSRLPADCATPCRPTPA